MPDFAFGRKINSKWLVLANKDTISGLWVYRINSLYV